MATLAILLGDGVALATMQLSDRLERLCCCEVASRFVIMGYLRKVDLIDVATAVGVGLMAYGVWGHAGRSGLVAFVGLVMVVVALLVAMRRGGADGYR